MGFKEFLPTATESVTATKFWFNLKYLDVCFNFLPHLLTVLQWVKNEGKFLSLAKLYSKTGINVQDCTLFAPNHVLGNFAYHL